MSLRRAVVIGAPVLAYVAALLHPRDVTYGDDPWPFIAVHLALVAILCLLAWMVLLLVEGVDGAAATAARALALPFAVAYAAYTTFSGITIGVFVLKTNELRAEEQQAAARLVHSVSHGVLDRPLYLTASLLWLATMLAVVVSLHGRAPLPALVLIAAGAAVFARTHVSPWGPAGMAAVAAGVVWVELKRTPAAELSRRSAARAPGGPSSPAPPTPPPA